MSQGTLLSEKVFFRITFSFYATLLYSFFSFIASGFAVLFLACILSARESVVYGWFCKYGKRGEKYIIPRKRKADEGLFFTEVFRLPSEGLSENFNFGLKEQLHFFEILVEKVEKIVCKNAGTVFFGKFIGKFRQRNYSHIDALHHNFAEF